MKLKPNQRVTYEIARARALAFLATQDYPIVASAIGTEIWPDNDMKAQGLGAASSRILQRMKEEGLVYWTFIEFRDSNRQWGYKITPHGRVTCLSMSA